MQAAFRDPRTGTITTGPTHACCWPDDAVQLCDLDSDAFLAGEGFLDGDRFLTRCEAFALTGISRSEQIEQGHLIPRHPQLVAGECHPRRNSR